MDALETSAAPVKPVADKSPGSSPSWDPGLLVSLEAIDPDEVEGFARLSRRTLKVLLGLAIFLVVLGVIKAVEHLLHSFDPPGWFAVVVGLIVAIVGEHFVGKAVEHRLEHRLDAALEHRMRKLDQLAETIELAAHPTDVPRLLQSHLRSILGHDANVFVASDDTFASWDAPRTSRFPENAPLLAQLQAIAGEGGLFVRGGARRQFRCLPFVHGRRIVGLLLVELPPGRLDRDALRVEGQRLGRLVRVASPRIAACVEARALARSAGLLPLVQAAAGDVGTWIAARLDEMARCAANPDMAGNDASLHKPPLDALDRDLRPHGFNGVYTLDASGVVLKHRAPPKVNIEGWAAQGREYFTDCLDDPKPLVSNWLLSSDRQLGIVVFVVPRFDAHGAFIGILDAVMDHPFKPFCTILANAFDRAALPDDGGFDRERLRLMLIDRSNYLLGVARGRFDESASLDNDPVVGALLDRIGHDEHAVVVGGAVARVPGTRFKVVAIERPVAS